MLKIKSVELVHEVIDLENNFVDVVVRDIIGYEAMIIQWS